MIQHETNEQMNSQRVLPSLAKLSVIDRLKVNSTVKVIVLCHGRPFEGHWQELVIRERTEELFADRLVAGEMLDFFTLDPQSDPNNPADFPMGGAQTLFAETKFSKNARWDMVWAPDCGGEWFHMTEMKGEQQRQRFTELVMTMSMSLKPGGFMMLGKLPFVPPYQSDTSLKQAIDLLVDAGFARAESAPMPDPYAPERQLDYILVQKKL